jgi:hypothetical protein
VARGEESRSEVCKDDVTERRTRSGR